MKLKMLIGLAGIGFSVAPREVTERFDGQEAHDLIAAGYAEEAPEEVPIKSAEEWAGELAASAGQLVSMGTKLDEAGAREKLLTDLLDAAGTKLDEAGAREALLVEQANSAAVEIAALTAKLDDAKQVEADLVQQLKVLQADGAVPVPAPKGRVSTKETAEKLPTPEKRV